MARTLQERVTRELEEVIGVCETYRSVDRASGEVVVYDSERGALKIGDGTPRSWRHFYNARCRELIRSMEISDKLLCLFNAELTATDDGYVVEVPQSEIETGSLESGEIYRMALISRDAAENKSSESSRSSRPSSEPQPPVEQGETRYVEVEDLGKQGDGIARVERGYVIIVPGAGIGEQVKVEISEVRSNFAVGEVIEEPP